jgi:hypothetical protein
VKHGSRVKLKRLKSTVGTTFDSLRPELWTESVMRVDGIQETAMGRRYAWLLVPGVEERISCPLELLELVEDPYI